MPLPQPRSGESRSDFISRCVSDDKVQQESETNDQAVAICSNIWEERNMSVNQKLLSAIKARQEKQTEFGYGILTADRHVKNLVDACGVDFCSKRFGSKSESFVDLFNKAKDTLVYSNSDLRVEKQISTSDFELPKNTLVAFKHVLTTPKKDRDGDVLRTEGADVDPNMLLLWQHVHTLPIGKMITIAEHDRSKLSLISAIVDMNELCHDAAVMVENDMARFSHGFRAFEFSELKEDEGETTSPGGFDIKKFEIMEESIVSVPANTDAQIEERMLDLIEGGRMTSDLMKEYGKSIREHRPARVSVELDIKTKINGKEVQDANEPRDRTEEKGSGAADSPEETKAAGNEEQTQEASDQKRVSGPLEGSWQWIDERLRAAASQFAREKIAGVSERDWVYTVATYSDYALLCVEKPESGVVDEFRYFKASWTMSDGNPMFEGEPQEVEIRVTAELLERSMKRTKSGRRLSRAVIADLKEIRDDLAELSSMDNMSRGAGALCRRCMDKLDMMIGEDYEDEDSTEPITKSITAGEAQAVFLKTATDAQLSNMKKIIDSMIQLTKSKNRTAAVRRLFKS